MDGYLDADQSIRLLQRGGGDIDSAKASASRSGCPGETYSA
jgi:hypothetical protein